MKPMEMDILHLGYILNSHCNCLFNTRSCFVVCTLSQWYMQMVSYTQKNANLCALLYLELPRSWLAIRDVSKHKRKTKCRLFCFQTPSSRPKS